MSRREILQQANPVVIKVGTNVLADQHGYLDRQRIRSLSAQISRVMKSRRVVLVSSGAIGAGIGVLKLGKRPADLPHLQACAAVGQSALMQLYREEFHTHQIEPAQILLTANDLDNRTRYLNARLTLLTLFEYGCLPIINENDTVSVAEIKFGDNDQLAALVGNLLHAPLLILLTNVDGLFTGDPRTDTTAQLVPTVENISQVMNLAATTKSHLGTGGMKSKLRAAQIATAAGASVIMANGSHEGIIDQIFSGETVGTLFLPQKEGLSARERWLAFTTRPKGILKIDLGAQKALLQEGRSLLPVGVRAVIGEFNKGDVVSICNLEGVEIARGLANYSHLDAEKMRGLTSEQITRALGQLPYVEMIHRDNLVSVQ